MTGVCDRIASGSFAGGSRGFAGSTAQRDRDVQRWGMQHRAGARIVPAYVIRVSGGADRQIRAARADAKEQKHVVRGYRCERASRRARGVFQ
jgi:hypothetical protein